MKGMEQRVVQLFVTEWEGMSTDQMTEAQFLTELVVLHREVQAGFFDAPEPSQSQVEERMEDQMAKKWSMYLSRRARMRRVPKWFKEKRLGR